MTAANRTTADRLIGDKGQALTITRRTAGAYDPATGTSAITETTQSGHGAILPLSPFRKSLDSIIAIGDQQLLLSALNAAGTALTAPKVDDTVTDANGNVWTIIAIEPLSPAGLAIIYDCIIRRAA